ncbi:hypothetical protein GCM10010965_30060 [Caldalkalibacillus thermarum]|uniref:sigma 54-interacting transcriptional regulator n=1 Tax=Caldalkalibacillus thermarum TaxID=296745 RepID=UPI00166B762F|nr:sigma 54-interacting transcriptional regulator [Caldalkalibacillus thermarum]GGK35074.1 hypothetical protein GCM10010965_30060 [Caldalkalibacillus thermarum]
MKRPKILLVTKDRRTYRVFYEQIADFFQDSKWPYTINGIHLVVNQTPIEIGREKAGVVTAFQDVTKIQQLEQDLRKELQAKGLSARYSVAHIVGNSARIQETLRILQKIAKTDQTVLILGENGTGKELFAHSIHDLSPRRNGPFLPVNFAGLPESLAESELFGYEEGAFTGAKKGGKPGLFELAHNGTIFLDEIGDASPALQALLLRVLQEKQVMRIGGRRMIPINVRVIAATNKDLKKMVEEGKFRQDLFYRLFVLPLRVPPLRERKEDIPLLVDHFLKEFCTAKVYIADEVMENLVAYHWPGNIRELISVIQYMTRKNEVGTFFAYKLVRVNFLKKETFTVHIARVEAKVIRTPFHGSFKTTYGEMAPYQEHLIVRITTDSGLTGIGEASPLPFFTGETAETMKIVVERELAPAILGKNIFFLREIHRIMNRVLGQASGAKSAIDLALWDLQGKMLALPVCHLFGGEPGKPVPVAYVLGDDTPDAMARQAREKVSQGFNTIKIKIGSDPKKDIEAVAKIREAVGPGVRLRVDANQGYTVKTAVQVIREISRYAIDYRD